MHIRRFNVLNMVIVAAAAIGAGAPPAAAQFSWDGECSTLWYDCCIVDKLYENNWATDGNPTNCPPLPGPTDAVSLSGIVDSGGGIISIASMFQTGLFLCYSQGLSILDGDIFTYGTIFEPGTFQLSGTINLYDGASFNIGSFSTLDFRGGEIRSYGTPGHELVIHGTLTKSALPAAYTRVSGVPIDNQGVISVTTGTLVVDAGGSNSGIIEALQDGVMYFEGGTYALDGEVRGDGLVHFHAGTANITGDYHPINTLIGGYPAVVNFETDTNVENLTLTISGTIGGAAELEIDDFIWYGSLIAPGGVVTVSDTALFQQVQPPLQLHRDMELHCTTTLTHGSTMLLNQAELRNFDDFQMQGDSNVAQGGSVPNAGMKNFGTLNKTGGGTSNISVGLSNDGGTVNVNSGTLILDSQMATTGPINVNAGAVLHMRQNQQTLFPEGSITGEGKVIFAMGSFDTSVDYLEGEYAVAETEIGSGTVQFQVDATTDSLRFVGGTLTGDGDFTINDELDFAWAASYMTGLGETKALGPVKMTYSGYLQRVMEVDNAAWNPSGPAPGGILSVIAGGELRGNGTIDGNLHDFNGIAPGLPGQSPIGALNITGNFTQFSIPPGVLKIDIAGAACDQLNMGGSATLSGSLLVSGTPASGQSYTILNAANIIGTFAQVNAPAGMTVQYTPTSVVLHAAGVLCPADVSPIGGDDAVNINDLLEVINGWGSCAAPCPPRCAADISPVPAGDCQININDLLEVINSWGPCP